MPNCQLVEISDSGHSLGVDQPDAFHDAIAAFLDAEENVPPTRTSRR